MMVGGITQILIYISNIINGVLRIVLRIGLRIGLLNALHSGLQIGHQTGHQSAFKLMMIIGLIEASTISPIFSMKEAMSIKIDRNIKIDLYKKN